MPDFSNIQPRRGTGCIKWDRVPEDVIPLSIADADWATAPAVLDAVRQQLDGQAVFGYSFGDAGFIEAVVRWFGRTYNFKIDPAWVVPLRGIVPALSALSALSDKAVLASVPNYSLLLTAPQRADRKLIPAALSEERHGAVLSYTVDFGALARDAEQAGMFYLCNPHNPIGKVYAREELQQLADFTRAHGLITVSDEIHGELVYDGTHVPWVTVAQENSITLMAPGKICNMPGIPLAFAIVPDSELRENVRRLSGIGGPGALNLAAGRGAYAQTCDAWKRALRDYLRGNRDWLAEQLHTRLPRARLTHPAGTYLQWIDLEAYGEEDAAQFLLTHARVALTGGAGFGATPHHVRLNFATSRALLTQALDRITEVFSSCP